MAALAQQQAACSVDALEAPQIQQVTLLTQPHLAQTLEIEAEAFPPCERLGEPLLQQQAALRTNGLLLAEFGTTVAGFLLFSRTGSSGLITKLAVHSAFRRRGIGSALMRSGIAQLEQAARRPPNEIMLHVDPTRTNAVSLYESFGFRQGTLLKQYYADADGGFRDALIMSRIRGSRP